MSWCSLDAKMIEILERAFFRNSPCEKVMIVEEAITSDKLEAVERLYGLRKPEEVRSFLARHSFVGPLLLMAHERIQSYFAPRELSLQVVADPEGRPTSG